MTDKHKLIFLSHASGDKEAADEVCSLLEARGISCWIAPRDVTPGKDYGEEIIDGIENTRGMVLLLSAASNASRHVRNEVERAVSKNKPIYPFLIEDITPSRGLEFFISSAHWIQAWKGSLEDATAQLAEAVSSLSDEPLPPAPAPGPAPRRGRKRKPVWIPATVVAVVACVAIAAAVVFLRGNTGGGDVFRGVRARTAAPADVAEMDYHALVIGINEYEQGGVDGWPSLKTARRDAEAVATELEKDYGFKVTRLLDADATRANIMAALDRLVTQFSDQAVLVYYAGHGFYEEGTDEGYWIPSDARHKDGARYTKEDWIWNSTINKLVESSKARHVLVIADSCYGGSLFRGVTDVPERQLQWYKRAFTAPSRYLITSGNLEPVLDGGGSHSIFAQQLLNYLKYPTKKIFSASDLGLAVRQNVSTMTGQLVRMGQMPVRSHAGGEFVFVEKGQELRPDAEAINEAEALKRAAAASVTNVPAQQLTQRQLQDAVEMFNQGATNSALRIVKELQGEGGESRLVAAVEAHMRAQTKREKAAEVRSLIERLEARKKAADAEGGEAEAPGTYARPRILACLGPTDRRHAFNDTLAELFRICLRAELQMAGGLVVVEREALEDVLAEMDLGSSALADANARTTVGKLLPASLLLLGDILPGGEGSKVYLRLVDTETTRMLGTLSGTTTDESDIGTVCAELAEKLRDKALKAKPFEARVRVGEGGALVAGVGAFHGADAETSLVVLRRVSRGDETTGFNETEVGRARIDALGDMASELEVAWAGEALDAGDDELWVREDVQNE